MKTEYVEYVHAGQTLEAFFAFYTNREQAPGILIFHAWKGRDAFVLEKAKWICSLGYVGIALDLYGKGILGTSPEDNQRLMDPFIQDRAFLLERIEAGVHMASAHPRVEKGSLGAMGFCFGGLCALDLARSGAPIRGAISIHGFLSPPLGMQSKPKGKILALHGHKDPMITPNQVEQFQEEMTQANIDWQLHVYGKALHAFTNPEANDLEAGTVYDPVAEKRTLQSVETFFKELYQG